MTLCCRWRDVAAFVGFLAFFTSIGSSLAIISGNVFGAGGYYVRILMWSPAMAAFATAILARKPISAFGWKWGEWRWQLQAWIVPLLYVSISYGLVWIFGWGKVPNPEFISKAAKSVALHISPGIASLLLIALTATLGMLDLGERSERRLVGAAFLFQHFIN